MPTSRFRGETGESLVESILTVAIMGIAFVAILFATGSAFRLSGVHRDQADTGVALGVSAEAVKAAESQPCQIDASTYSDDLPGPAELPQGVSVSITDATCDDLDLDLQMIDIQATTADGTARTTSVIKRSPS